MAVLQPGRRVLLGVTGSIAAYKSADIASKLVQMGVTVHAILTESGARFITPLTLESLTGHPAGVSMWDSTRTGGFKHLDAVHSADLVLIAPATGNFIAKMAGGIADDLLSAAVLAARAPILVAPAMNTAMLDNPATQANISLLRSRGVEFVGPDDGRLACGEQGRGRMCDVQAIVDAAAGWLERAGSWKGRRVLVTAGPTREMLDGVRFISNPSSGKMGFAVARAAARRGAAVTLVTGPTDQPVPPGVEVIRVVTGEEMRQAVVERFAAASLLVKTAAVTDYRAAAPAGGKTKSADWTVKLEKVGNILDALAKDRNGQVVVGFAAEAGDPESEGKRKMAERKLDLLVANDVSGPEGAFAADSSNAMFILPDGSVQRLPRMGKGELASKILDAVELKVLKKTG